MYKYDEDVDQSLYGKLNNHFDVLKGKNLKEMQTGHKYISNEVKNLSKLALKVRSKQKDDK